MPKVILFEGVPVIRCPGCGNWHYFNPPSKPAPSGAKWTWNEERDRPTFSPSMNEACNPPDHPQYQPDFPSTRCHSFVSDGRIQFLSDSTHKLAGKTVDLPEWDEGNVAMEEARGEVYRA